MAEYAPDAIRALGQKIAAALGGEVSGIVGDASHTYGYHRARNVLPASDYSVRLSDDKAGDGWAASALDVSLPPDKMKLVTRRLLDSALDANDPRLDPLREFFGTLDGSVVTGYDCVERHYSSSDTSHLWHVHLSILRKHANDPAAMASILSVIVGSPSTGGTMASPLDDKAFADLFYDDIFRTEAIKSLRETQAGGPQKGSPVPFSTVINQMARDVTATKTTLAAVAAKLDASAVREQAALDALKALATNGGADIAPAVAAIQALGQRAEVQFTALHAENADLKAQLAAYRAKEAAAAKAAADALNAS